MSTLRGVNNAEVIDRTDARILLALIDDPRATVLAIAERVGMSRNTVQARLARFDDRGFLSSFENRINPAALGYPLTSFISIQVTQRQLAEVATALAAIPEVIEVSGLSGAWDLLARVVARDADDLYRIAGEILATPGVERTESSLVMRRLVNYRLSPLLEKGTGRIEGSRARL
jgi:DNA-binding Lrp family transcriptional regulator